MRAKYIEKLTHLSPSARDASIPHAELLPDTSAKLCPHGSVCSSFGECFHAKWHEAQGHVVPLNNNVQNDSPLKGTLDQHNASAPPLVYRADEPQPAPVLDPAVEACREEMKELRQMVASLQKDRKTVGLEFPADERPMCTGIFHVGCHES